MHLHIAPGCQILPLNAVAKSHNKGQEVVIVSVAIKGIVIYKPYQAYSLLYPIQNPKPSVQ